MNYSALIEKPDDDHIYYNIVMLNNTPDYIKADYVAYLSDPILNNPTDYHLSVVRFSIAGNTLPIFFYPNTISYNLPSNPPQALNNFYSVTLSYSGSDYQEFINYVPSTPSMSPYNVYYFAITSYQNFINMINTALTAAYNRLKFDFPGSAFNQAPYFIYDPETLIISLVVENAFIGLVDIYMNQLLNVVFLSFRTNNYPNTSPNGKEAQILLTNATSYAYSERPINIPCATTAGSAIVTSAGLFTSNMTGSIITGYGILENTTITYNNANQITLSQNATQTGTFNLLITKNNLTRISQEYQSLAQWSDLSSIFITSNMPTKAEYITVSGSGNIQDGTQRILTDFKPTYNSAADYVNGNIVYTPTAEYRLLDMSSTSPLTQIDASIKWQSKNGKIYDFFINPFSSASIKLMFRKK
jgi:hypothetical protein